MSGVWATSDRRESVAVVLGAIARLWLATNVSITGTVSHIRAALSTGGFFQISQ